jgi:hypothetical protein
MVEAEEFVGTASKDLRNGRVQNHATRMKNTKAATGQNVGKLKTGACVRWKDVGKFSR